LRAASQSAGKEEGENRSSTAARIGAGLMNSRQKTIIRVLQLIFYPIAAIMLVGFAWNFYRIMTGQGEVEILTDADRAPETDWVAVAVVGLFWFVFLALLIEFLAREILRRHPRDGLGTALVEIGRTNSPLRFLLVVGVLPFVVGLNLILLRPEALNIDPAQISLQELMAFWLFYGIAHFLLVAFVLRALRNRPFFILTDKGFLYEPGDISPGLIRWEDVAEIKEAQLLTSRGRYGPTTGTVLAVALKNPEDYAPRYTPLLRMLNAALTPLIRYQTGGPGDIVLASEDFGARYGEIKDLMTKHVSGRSAFG
jgi:hypothetical protein